MNIHKGIKHVEIEDGNYSQAIGIGLTAVLFTYQVPQKQTLILKKFGNYCSAVGAWAGLAVWRIIRNNVGIFPYDDILEQLGTSQEPRDIKPLIFQGGDLLVINCSNNTAGIIDMGIAITYEVMDT